ncbi:MAG: hypothetical protein OEM38_05740 [Gammaproteobacteria bacterium]|nr:hypothetical protein [Gammaproteobacteria bacterium]
MHFIKKDLSILIIATDYWRFRFFKKLFESLANIKLIVIRNENELSLISDKGYDLVIWELELGFSPPDIFLRDKIVLASYRDESHLPELQLAAKLWGLPQHRFLQLVVDKSEKQVFPLPLPPPKITKQFAGSPNSLSLRKSDLFFLCSPTYIYMNEKTDMRFTAYLNNRWCYNQRLEWVTSLYESGRLPAGQGLIEPDIEYLGSKVIGRDFKFDLDTFVRSLDRKNYSQAMLDSKLILCPGGHSRWTYRHFEGFFNRGLVISTDLERVCTTPEIPAEVYVAVKDGAFSVDGIDDMLNSLNRLQSVADCGYEYAQDLIYPKSLLRNSGYKPDAVQQMFNKFSSWLSSNS